MEQKWAVQCLRQHSTHRTKRGTAVRLTGRDSYYTSYYTEGYGPLKNLGAPYIFKHFDVIAQWNTWAWQVLPKAI